MTKKSQKKMQKQFHF